MKKKFILAAVVLFLILPALSFSNNMDMKAQDKEAVNMYSINFRNIEANSLALPEDHESRHTNSYGDKFNALKSTYIVGQSMPQPIVSSISIEPYFEERDKSFKPSMIPLPSSLGEVLTTGSAFLTNLVAHEFGHAIIGDHVGATGNKVSFFEKKGGQFFLGMSSVKNIKTESKLPYTMGGEFFADLTFEHALKSYRKNPTFYNKSLMLYSGTDFLWYCFYAFYLSDGHANFDPVTVAQETGLSKDELFSIVLAKTMINTYRVYSGQDKVVPYFTVNSSSAALNLSVPF